MKVIFLDFDGVLNSRNYRETVEDYYENYIDESRLFLIKYIVEKTGAVIVLTTTWRHYWDKKDCISFDETIKINKIFKKYGLEIYSKTNSFDEDRDYEIRDWVKNNNPEKFVILDDVEYNWSSEISKCFVQTNDEIEGLDEDSTQKAIDILQN